MRAAVVAAGYTDPWREDHLLARRLSGALACSTEVDLLVPGGPRRAVEHEGAVRVFLFPSTPPEPRRRRAWRQAVFGSDQHRLAATGAREHGRGLPQFAERELLNAEGGDSPELYDHLRATPYDVTVFVGFHTPACYSGVRALADGHRCVLVPGSRDEEVLWLRVHDEVFQRADRILVCTESERAWIGERAGSGSADRIDNLGFVVGVNSLGARTEPPDFDGKHYLIMAGNWHEDNATERALRWARRVENEVDPDIRLRFVGPGAERLPLGLSRTASRLDMWRWVSRAFALLDPAPGRLIGREALEAYLYGTPIVVSADGRATQEHAERGNGGLWYRTDDEFYAVVEALRDDDLRSALGQQGRAYAQEAYADTDSYIKRVAATVLPQ
jgi:glycosyltransferase involved in cell wall biosynthesis